MSGSHPGKDDGGQGDDDEKDDNGPLAIEIDSLDQRGIGEAVHVHEELSDAARHPEGEVHHELHGVEEVVAQEGVVRGQHVAEEAEDEHSHGGSEVLEVAQVVEDEDSRGHDVAKVTHAHGLAVRRVLLALDSARAGAGRGADQQRVVDGVAEAWQDVPLTDTLYTVYTRSLIRG